MEKRGRPGEEIIILRKPRYRAPCSEERRNSIPPEAMEVVSMMLLGRSLCWSNKDPSPVEIPPS